MAHPRGESSNTPLDAHELFNTLSEWETALKDVPEEYLTPDPEPGGP